MKSTQLPIYCYDRSHFGMLFVVKPEFSSSMIPAIGGLLSGIFAASAYTCVRALSSKEAPYTIVFIFLSSL